MNYTLSKLAIFVGGAAIGSVVTWRILNKRYEQQIQQELAEAKEYYARRAAEGFFDSEAKRYEKDVAEPFMEGLMEGIKALDKDPVMPSVSSIQEYAEMLQNHGYVDYSSGNKPMPKEVTDVVRPYVISPDEFDERRDEGYETESLTFYADGVLADDTNEPIDDIDKVVGKDSLTHFGEYEDDSVFVRNEAVKIDFEILLDPRNFEDVVKKGPHLAD